MQVRDFGAQIDIEFYMMRTTPQSYASIGRRAIAMLIDGSILIILGLVLFNKEYSITGPGLKMGLIPLLFAWLYFALQDSSAAQATLGKRVMNIHIASSDGTPVDFKQASLRYLGKLVSSFIALIGYIIALFDAKRLTLHDRMAGTVVLDD